MTLLRAAREARLGWRVVAAAGWTPDAQTREVYHVWHGPDSPDDRIELQIGLAP